MPRPAPTIAALALALALSPALQAQDVMKVAGNHTRVLLDNAQVRVVQNTLEPGESDPTHTHPKGWYYVTEPGRMKVVFADGRTEMWDAKPGESGWIAGEGPHTSENVGTTPITYVLVEMKGEPRVRASRPHTGRGSHSR